MRHRELRNLIIRYVFAVAKYWYAIIAGIALGWVDVFERTFGTWLIFPVWVRVTTTMLGLVVAQFLAYRDLEVERGGKVRDLETALEMATMGDAPQVILDYEPFFTDQPRKREGSWIVRNTGPKAAVNVLVEAFAVGKHRVTCDPVNRLLPSDTAKLTCEVRSGDDIRKPCLLWLEGLFEVELGDKTIDQGTAIPLTIRYGDLTGRKYLVEYSLTYRIGINEVLAEFRKIDVVG